MKNYRILRLAGLHYPGVVQKFISQNPGFIKESYDNQLLSLFKYSPIYSNAFSDAFSKLGQEAFEIIFDFEILQKQWATENGISYNAANWEFEIMMAQIAKIKPDVIYFQGTEMAIPGRFIKENILTTLPEILKQKFPFVKLVAMVSGYPCGPERIKDVDVFFAGSHSLVYLYKKMGFSPTLLYHSFDDMIVKKLQQNEEKYEFTFAGATRAPETRYWVLRELMAKTNLEMWLFEDKQVHNQKISSSLIKRLSKKAAMKFISLCSESRIRDYLYSPQKSQTIKNVMIDSILDDYYRKGVKNRKVYFGKLPTQTLNETYPERCHPAVMGMDMYNLLHQSKVTFNKHADMAAGDVGNMRLFEATGVGTCLLTDTGNNMSDLYEADKEVVIYKNVDEAVEKAKYLMEHPEVAQEIAAAGQKRTLKDHTTKVRSRQIDEIIQAKL
jgi:spore maturation protein CgeB